MKEENKGRSPDLVSGAMLSAFIPVYGYYSAYLFEKGFCKQFNIPQPFIEISLSDVFKTIGILIPLIIVLYMGFEIFFKALESASPIIRGLGRIILATFYFFLIQMIAGFSKTLFYFFLIYIGLEVFAEFLIPLFRGFKGYKKRLESLQNYEQEKRKRDVLLIDKILKDIIERTGVFTFFILSLLIISLFFVDSLGESHAKNQKSFIIIKSEPELVILRKYAKNFICATFNRENKEINKNFYIKSIDQIAEEGFQIVEENIGPLQAAKTKINKK